MEPGCRIPNSLKPSNWKTLFQANITRKEAERVDIHIQKRKQIQAPLKVHSMNGSSIAFFHHFFPYIARPFEKITAPLMINLLSQDVNIVQSGHLWRRAKIAYREQMRNFVRTLFGEVNSLASSRCMRHLGAESVPKGCSGPVSFLPRVDLERMKGLSLAKKGEVRDSKHPHLN